MQVRPLISRALRLLWIGIKVFEMCSIEGIPVRFPRARAKRSGFFGSVRSGSLLNRPNDEGLVRRHNLFLGHISKPFVVIVPRSELTWKSPERLPAALLPVAWRNSEF